jgi:polyisoprenyl-phosphate glycosyltransferase
MSWGNRLNSVRSDIVNSMNSPHEGIDSSPTISVVVPLYNEAEGIDELYRRLVRALNSMEVPYEIVFVNDGSRDATPRLLDALQGADKNLVVIHLSRNFGHQAAVSAGIDHACGAAVIVMDGDLQDPPEILWQFVDKWREGFEVVYAVRCNRKESPLKRLGYFAFYRVMSAISNLDIPLDSGDFCLMDRKVVDVLKHLPERMRFVRGLRSFAGFRQVGLEYERAARERGQPKYTFGALVGLAVDGLVSFSSYPLRLVTRLALATILLTMVLLVWVLVDAFARHSAPAGWASSVVVVLFMGSVELFSLGIICEYIRLIFLEVKQRPTYIVGACKRATDDRGCLVEGQEAVDGGGVDK